MSAGFLEPSAVLQDKPYVHLRVSSVALSTASYFPIALFLSVALVLYVKNWIGNMQMDYQGDKNENETTPSGPSWVTEANKMLKQRFAEKVFFIVFAQLAVTMFIIARMYAGSFLAHPSVVVICQATFIVLMGLFVGLHEEAKEALLAFPGNYGWMALFTFCYAVLIGDILLSTGAGAQVVLVAAFLALVLFASLVVYASSVELDYTGEKIQRSIVLGSLLLAEVFGLLAIASSVFGFAGVQPVQVIACAVAVWLACMGVLMHVQMIISGGYTDEKKNEYVIDDYCYAAMALYIELVNLFLKIVELIQSLDDKNERRGKRGDSRR